MVVDSATGEVLWADHESFAEVSDEICCPPPVETYKTGEWTYVYGYTPQNVRKALRLLDSNILDFLAKCLRGEMEATIDAVA